MAAPVATPAIVLSMRACTDAWSESGALLTPFLDRTDRLLLLPFFVLHGIQAANRLLR